MWNILLVLIIAIIIFAFNPLKSVDFRPQTQVDSKTQNEVNQVVNQATQQVDYAKQMQQQENQTLNNN